MTRGRRHAPTNGTYRWAVSTSRIERFRRDNLTFEVIDTGPIDGTPVVLLHGFPQRGNAWNQVAERLHDAGLRTLAPDQRGYSPGARPRSRFAYSFRAIVADAVALIDEIGGPTHVAGHDLGAAIGWSLAARHPERVRSLTAVSVGHPRAFLRAAFTSEQARRSYYLALFQIPLMPERTLSSHGARGQRSLRDTGMPEESFDQFRREIVGDGALRGGLNWYRSLPLIAPKDLGTVSVPSTLVWSDDDAALGRKMAEVTAKYVSGPYALIELSGSHWLLEERPDDVADAIIRRIQSVEKVS
jgi:pimeloyl-ACP methyl ester carboxylesterase